MKQVNTKIAKFVGAAALLMMVSTAATAQDYTSERNAEKAYVKTAQLERQTPAPSFDIKPAKRIKTTKTRTTRRIVREALPGQRNSVRTVNKGRVFVSEDFSHDGMTVYTPPAKGAKMPNYFAASQE